MTMLRHLRNLLLVAVAFTLIVGAITAIPVIQAANAANPARLETACGNAAGALRWTLARPVAGWATTCEQIAAAVNERDPVAARHAVCGGRLPALEDIVTAQNVLCDPALDRWFEVAGDALWLVRSPGESRPDGGGMVVAAGTLSTGIRPVGGGALDLACVPDTTRWPASQDPGYATAFAWIREPCQVWQQLGHTGTFAQTAQDAAALWEAQTGERVDTVIAVDGRAPGALIADLDGGVLEQYLTVGQYEGDVTAAGSDQRRAATARTATISAARTLLASDAAVTVETVVARLDGLLADRMIEVWTATDGAWAPAPSTGTVRVAIDNQAGTKADQAISVDVTRTGDRWTVTAVNDPQLIRAMPEYVSCPYPCLSTDRTVPWVALAFGRWAGNIVLTFPAGTAIRPADGAPLVTATSTGDGEVAVFDVHVNGFAGADASNTARFEFTATGVPAGAQIVYLRPTHEGAVPQ